MADLGLGTSSLALEVVNSSISVIKFIAQWVSDARHFGDDVTSLRTRLTCEMARLEYLSRYLQEKRDGATPKFESMPLSVQSAVLGLVQELEIDLAVYSAFVAKHKIEDLQSGYARTFERGLDDDLHRKRKEEIQVVSDKATVAGRLKWGLFEKKRLTKLLDGIEDWNSRLMNLLLCGFCFGTASEQSAAPEKSVVTGLGLSQALTLRTLINSQGQAISQSPPRRDWTGEPGLRLEMHARANSRLGTLVRAAASDGTGAAATAERTRVFVETKAFRLQRRALEPSAAVKQRVGRLADLLAHAGAPEAGFRTLRCVGVVRVSVPDTAYAFAFELPESEFGGGAGPGAEAGAGAGAGDDDDAPYTLLRALERRGVVGSGSGNGVGDRPRPTLNERFAMARALALTLFQLHSVGWLHKSIRSDNVLLALRRRPTGGGDVCDYARPVLVGFEFARDDADVSTTEQDDRPDRNVYRHPDRQGPPDTRFAARHDVYALGVVLLEIGLWQSAPRIDARFGPAAPPLGADGVMAALCEHARLRLPHYMGVDYADAVVACLRGTVCASSVAGGGGGVQHPAMEQEESRMRDLMALFELVINKIGGVKTE